MHLLSFIPRRAARLRELEAENASLRARLAAAQDRALSIAFEREEAINQAAAARTARDRCEEIVIGAMRHVLRGLDDADVERFDARRAVYVRELGLSAPAIHRLDPYALEVERVRRRVLRREAA